MTMKKNLWLFGAVALLLTGCGGAHMKKHYNLGLKRVDHVEKMDPSDKERTIAAPGNSDRVIDHQSESDETVVETQYPNAGPAESIPSPGKRTQVEDRGSEAWSNNSFQEVNAVHPKKSKTSELEQENPLRDWQDESGETDTDTLLLVIIALFIPPLAVGLYEGITSRFWISLLLTILFFLPGLIYAILVVTGTI
jgi:uncharacterized membrane protein YqaE (UPF0057 family)